jgi:hypothetical protein
VANMYDLTTMVGSCQSRGVGIREDGRGLIVMSGMSGRPLERSCIVIFTGAADATCRVSAKVIRWIKYARAAVLSGEPRSRAFLPDLSARRVAGGLTGRECNGGRVWYDGARW